MQSMTGYGKAEHVENGITLSVEIKTVNNRFLDLIPKYPRAFAALDDAIRKTVQSKINRGRVELYVNYSNVADSGKTVVVDTSLAEKYVQAATALKEKFGVQDDLSLTSLMRLPDVLTEKIDDDASETIHEILIFTLNLALDKLNEMRKAEGEKLKADLFMRNENILELVAKIEERAPKLKAEYEKRLKDKMQEILGDVKYDETRLLQEVALFADKSDINEELTRLKSHISQLKSIADTSLDVGKKLDFLMQEFNREANTICSKSNDIEITKYALALKNEIEKMREQVQNIE